MVDKLDVFTRMLEFGVWSLVLLQPVAAALRSTTTLKTRAASEAGLFDVMHEIALH